MELTSIPIMTFEILRLAVGLMIAYFHRPIADFIMERERALVVVFRQRGVPVPAPPTTETARNIYFMLGMVVVGIEMIRIWALLHPESFASMIALH